MYLCPCLKHICNVYSSSQVKFGNTTFKTDVCPKSLNPQWNSEWFKFEVIEFLTVWTWMYCKTHIYDLLFFRCFFCFLGWGRRLAGWALTGHGSGPWHLQCEWCHRESLHWHWPTTMQRGCLCHFWLVSHLWHYPWYNSKWLRRKRF